MDTDTVVNISEVSENIHVITRTVSCWDRAYQELHYFSGDWVFRGHQDSKWILAASITRWARGSDAVAAEQLILGSFMRRAHLHMNGVSAPETELEWLALLRHHGGPCRLLDVTRSPFIAAHFALSQASEEKQAAIWALRSSDCQMAAVEFFRKYDEKFKHMPEWTPLDEPVTKWKDSAPPLPFVAPVMPFRANARMANQQGMFLCVGDPGKSLIDNLVGQRQTRKIDIIKLEFPCADRGRALAMLGMTGVTAHTLFPDLDGLALAAAHEAVHRDIRRETLLLALSRPSGWPDSDGVAPGSNTTTG